MVLAFGACMSPPSPECRHPSQGYANRRLQQGKSWATELLGIAATLAGFLGITRATQDVNLSDGTRAQIAGGGMAGILAGATLAGVGGLPVPIGLATMAAGATTVGIVYMLRRLR